MNGTIFSAGCLELLPSFAMDRVLELVETGRITKFFAVPTVYIRFLSLPDLEKRLGKLRYCFSAAASMAMEVVKQWKERTGITIAESFGQTECMPITFNHYYPERHVVGSVGHPVHGMEVQIRDLSGKLVKQGQEGEICMRGRNVMKAYLNNPEGTRDAFWDGEWLRSGDIGVIDHSGYVFIVDRLKDLIITGGENVYPREVEEQLYASPDVEECAVIGLPDKEWGERVVAYIVAKPGRTVVADGGGVSRGASHRAASARIQDGNVGTGVGVLQRDRVVAGHRIRLVAGDRGGVSERALNSGRDHDGVDCGLVCRKASAVAGDDARRLRARRSRALKGNAGGQRVGERVAGRCRRTVVGHRDRVGEGGSRLGIGRTRLGDREVVNIVCARPDERD